jgi:hypothetical protein
MNKLSQLTQFSTWRNDNDVPAQFRLMTHEKIKGSSKQPKDGSVFEYVNLLPGETIQLPSEYDAAIRKVGKLGSVSGGLCPWLVKVGDEVRIDTALDYKKAIENEQLLKLAEELEKESVLSKALDEMKRRRAAIEIGPLPAPKKNK